MRSDEEGDVSDWVLERFVLGELPERQARWIDGLVHARGDVADRVAAIRRSNEDILAQHPVRPTVAAIGSRARASAQSRRALLGGLALVGAVAAVALVVPVPDGTRTKGAGAQLGVHRRTDHGNERLTDGSAVRAGDRLQVVFAAAGARHAAVLSLDGAGTVTLHWPANDDTRVTGPTVALGTAFELDDAPEFERFVLVTGTEPIDLRVVRDDLQRIASTDDPAREPLRLVKGVDWQDVLLLKSEGR